MIGFGRTGGEGLQHCFQKLLQLALLPVRQCADDFSERGTAVLDDLTSPRSADRRQEQGYGSSIASLRALDVSGLLQLVDKAHRGGVRQLERQAQGPVGAALVKADDVESGRGRVCLVWVVA